MIPKTQVDIKPAATSTTHHPAAYKLFCSHRHEPWQYPTFERALLLPNSLFAILNGQLVGYLLASEVMGELEVEDVCVAEKYRKQGLASQIFDHFIQQCIALQHDYIFLEVSSRNVSARKLYEKKGFYSISIRKNYYKLANNEFVDAVLMRRDLTVDELIPKS